MTNNGSVAAQKNLSISSRGLQKSIQRLSSGLRLNSASDDAAGMAVSTGLRAQLGGYQQASRNANDAIAIMNTAEGGLNSISDTLIRMRELSVQAASDGITDTERDYIETEFQDLRGEIDRVSKVTEYNGINLLDGSAGSGGTVTFQVGTRNSANDRISATLSDMGSSSLGVKTNSVSTLGGAQTSITTIDTAISTLSTHRSTIGSTINTLDSAVTNLGNTIQNVSSAVSQIRDADIASESASFASSMVLQQAGVAMLAQANQTPNLALRLL